MHKYLDPFVIDYVIRSKGSIQAKFGVGLQI
jgi:FAD/FMN-containing dehydrogenase